MASATDQQISALFGELKKTATNGQDEKSLDICDEILQLNPADDVALRCKVVTLIRLGQYADALAVMSSASNISDDVWAFENIYCYYRENQLEPAFQLLERVKAQQRETSDIALEYLEAQMVKSPSIVLAGQLRKLNGSSLALCARQIQGICRDIRGIVEKDGQE